ncbi:MAG: hypothetical protein JSV27_10760 [Candidatus Bathyarchaeota archaeon]|nr:MAG: hypothetical protein JSV27_10760 [Candidatus Bathyarchaeota archaeon]
MSQLVCPLCGRFVSLSRFDPSFFESDIFAVNVRGLGRGKGFAVSETFSVLGERAVTDPIADRCRVILGVIEGMEVLSGDEGAVLRAEVERWKREAQRERLVGEELFAKLVELEERNSLWRGEVSRLRSQLEERAAELALMEEEALRWKGVASELRAEVGGLRFELAEADEEEDEYDEEEMLASEEMQEILDRINASANADFECLSDAVDFLLEEG